MNKAESIFGLKMTSFSWAYFQVLPAGHLTHQGPVVQRLIGANPVLNFNPGFYISLFKSPFGIILLFVLRAFNYQIVVKKK